MKIKTLIAWIVVSVERAVIALYLGVTTAFLLYVSYRGILVIVHLGFLRALLWAVLIMAGLAILFCIALLVNWARRAVREDKEAA